MQQYFISDACGHSFIINSDNGLRQHHIKSPGYPHGYSNKMDCVWSIYNSDRRPISISFKGSSLEVCHRRFSCDCDFVGIITIDTEGDQKPKYVVIALAMQRNAMVYMPSNIRMCSVV